MSAIAQHKAKHFTKILPKVNYVCPSGA
jgi:hypothetical protein